MSELNGVSGKYYNSDLNEYIGKMLPKVMTAIDQDLVLVKKFPKDGGGPILRVCEYKHSNEPMGREQRFTLNLFADIFTYLNANGFERNGKRWRFGVYELRGDPPFDKGILCRDIITGEERNMSKDEMDEFLTMERR